MARPKKEGFDYFPLDVDMNDSMQFVQAKHGLEGWAIVVKLWSRIYKGKGYYCQWSEKHLYLFANSIGTTNEKVSEVLDTCFEEGVFDRGQYERNGILTSEGIQERFEQISKDAKRKNFAVNSVYSVLTPEKTPLIPEETMVNSVENPPKKSKVNKRREENESTREQNDSSSLIRPGDVARILSAGGWAGVDAIGMNYAVCRAASELNLGPGQIIARAKAFAGYCKKADWNGQFKSSFAKWINDRSEGVALDWAVKLEADFKNDTEQIKLPSPWSKTKN